MVKESAAKTEVKAGRLPWEYCECGCRGHAVTVGSSDLWIDSRNYTLHAGHGWSSPLISRHKSFEEANRAARELLKPEFARMKAFVEKNAHLFE